MDTMNTVVSILMASWAELTLIVMVGVALVIGIAVIHTEIKDRAEHEQIRKELLILIELNKQIAANTTRVTKNTAVAMETNLPRAVRKIENVGEKVIKQVPHGVEDAVRNVIRRESGILSKDTTDLTPQPPSVAPKPPVFVRPPGAKTVHDPENGETE